MGPSHFDTEHSRYLDQAGSVFCISKRIEQIACKCRPGRSLSYSHGAFVSGWRRGTQSQKTTHREPTYTAYYPCSGRIRILANCSFPREYSRRRSDITEFENEKSLEYHPTRYPTDSPNMGLRVHIADMTDDDVRLDTRTTK